MAAIAVTAPDPGFAGTRAGVVFREGVAEVDAGNAVALAYFARHGYALDAPAAPASKGRRARSAAPEADAAPAAPEAEG